jgi:hypothetical protein
VDGAERGGYVVLGVCEKSAGNSLKFFLGQVPGKLAAKYASIRHYFFSFLLNENAHFKNLFEFICRRLYGARWVERYLERGIASSGLSVAIPVSCASPGIKCAGKSGKGAIAVYYFHFLVREIAGAGAAQHPVVIVCCHVRFFSFRIC